MIRRTWTAALAVTTIGLAALPAAAGAKAGVAAADCAPGDATAAGVALYGAGTEFSRSDKVGGLNTALVLEQYIAPGTRHRLIAVPGGFCDAETAFNKAWKLNGHPVGDGNAMAAAYAQLAAAPYFDQTSVTSQRDLAGVHTITTHALTNGVAAKWVVLTDATGVRSAKWAETAYAVKPFQAEFEGLTAVDGANEHYARLSTGLLKADRGLPTREDLTVEAPAAEVSFTGADGFKVVVGIGDTRQGVDVGTDTGNERADILRLTRQVLQENYSDFNKWGFVGNWATAKTRAVLVNSPAQIPAPAKTGYVSINDGTSAYCQACVFIADDFQIHFISEVGAFLDALGYSYGNASPHDVLHIVLGHEMFHNWQNNYVKPASSGRSVPGSYSEGTARFQQTLHDTAAAEHQSTTLLYANDANGCNGFAGSPPDTAFAGGAFQTPAYTACNFWMGWYGFEGGDALVKLVTTGMPYDVDADDPPTQNADKVIQGIATATGKPYSVSAAEWATNIITRQKLTWGPLLGNGPAIDWSTWLERWTPTQLAVGESATRTLANGGVMANEVTGAFRPTITDGAGLAVARNSASGVTLSYPANGSLVAAPAPGERVYVIGVWPAQGSQSVTVTAGRP